MDTYSERNLKSDLKKAKEEADASIVYLHGGKDDSTEPDKKLLKRIDFLAEQGADVVICSHPHILKGYEKVKRPDGKDMLVYYSLGNFANGQSKMENLLGGMAKFTLKRNAKSGEVTVKNYSLEPLVMHYNADYSECGIYKLSDYTETMAQEHGIHETGAGEEFTLKALKSAAENIAEITGGEEIPDEKPSDEKSSDTKEKTA